MPQGTGRAWGTGTPGAEAKEMCITRSEILFNPGLMDAEALYDRCSDKTGRTAPRASFSARSLLRSREVLQVLHAKKDTVVAVFAGHDHDGGFSVADASN
ncbi:unnamed protein product [Effrenium voratum]|uniref:Uncharacterized protein n=1 Tax=Effrenium voratum TaxID=2562239 RepID=A0AA36J821_9DINO|nr:unnamed protein product [Effrenium voratum]